MKLLLIAIVSNSYGFLNNEDILRLSYTYLGRVLRHIVIIDLLYNILQLKLHHV